MYCIAFLSYVFIQPSQSIVLFASSLCLTDPTSFSSSLFLSSSLSSYSSPLLLLLIPLLYPYRKIDNVSDALRAEFARGDGRVKQKEDERRKNIEPSETLFVVNFHEQTTRREDLQMLFEPYGELVRIDMKRNYAFVQFRTIAQATKAKEATNGGKLDQSVLTVEYVARQRIYDSGRDSGRGSRDRDRGDRRGGGGYGGRRDRYDDRRGGSSFGGGGGGSAGRGPPAYNDRGSSRGRGGDRYDERYDGYRSRSPVGYRGGGGRAHSRSRSPLPRHGGGSLSGGYRRSRSPLPPPPRRYDDRVGGSSGGGGGDYRRSPPREYHSSSRGRSPEMHRGSGSAGEYGDRDRDMYRDRDRGYRP